MVVARNSITRTLERWTETYRQRKRRRFGERVMNELPPSLQRDIDWTPGWPMRRG